MKKFKVKKKPENDQETISEEEIKSKKKFNIIQASNFILAGFLIYFFVFGYIATVYEKYPDENLLFVYKSFFSTYSNTVNEKVINAEITYVSYVSSIIFILIMILQGYREKFLVYAVKNSIWMVPIMLILSWIWYSINYQVSIFPIIGQYFSSGYGYINILVLLGMGLASSLLGGYLKTLRYQKLKEMEIAN